MLSLRVAQIVLNNINPPSPLLPIRCSKFLWFLGVEIQIIAWLYICILHNKHALPTSWHPVKQVVYQMFEINT